MGRKSTTRGVGGLEGKGRSLLVTAALLLLTLTSACAPAVRHDVPGERSALTRAKIAIREGRLEEGISRLKPLLKKSAYRCQAAFYLFALDVPRDDHLEILHSKACAERTPAYVKMVDRLINSEQELEGCLDRVTAQNSEVAWLKKRISVLNAKTADLERETSVMEKEISRLRFELDKMEEIRRETERWRVK